MLPQTPTEAEIAERIKAGDFPGFNLQDQIESILDSFLGEAATSVEPQAFGFSADVWFIWYVANSGSIEVEDVSIARIDDTLLLLEADVSLTAEFDAEIDARSDLARGQGLVFDLDEMVAHGTVQTQLSARIQMTLNTDAQDVTSTAVLRLAVDHRDIEYTGGSTEDLLNEIRNYQWHIMR